MSERSRGLLLDTPAAIWLVNNELSSQASKRVSEAGNAQELFLSPVSAWEIGLLASPSPKDSNSLRFDPDPVSWFERLLAETPIRLAPFTPRIALNSSFLPGRFHTDPADRLLVSTARELDLALLTRDRRILAYSKSGHVKAIAC